MEIQGVPPLDLSRQYRDLLPLVSQEVNRVISSGAFILGPDVSLFEKEIAEWQGAPHAVAVSNGTDALFMALRASGIKPGDHVLSSPFTFFATVSATLNIGAVPVFADIDPQSFNLDPHQVEKILKADHQRKIKALIPVHLYGQACDMAAFRDLSRRFEVALIEDACQSIGALVHQEKKAGTWGDYGCFSLYPTKNLGAIGDAGFILTQTEEKADQLRAIRNHGSRARYIHDEVGSNFRMDTVQAAALRVFLPHLSGWIEQRQKAAELYNLKLEKSSQIRRPHVTSFSTHVFHQYTVRVPEGKREKLQAHLASKKVGTTVYYPIPCHLQKALEPYGFKEGDFPQAELAAREVLSLPIFPGISEEEIAYVVRGIEEFLDSDS